MDKLDFVYRQAKSKREDSIDDIFSLSTIGFTSKKTGFSTPYPIPDYMFTFILNGNYKFSIWNSLDEYIDCGPNTLVIYKPKQNFKIIPQSENCQRIWLHCKGSIMTKLLKELNIHTNQVFHLSDGEKLNVLNRFENLKSTLTKNNNNIAILQRTLSFLNSFNQVKRIDDSIENYLDKTIIYINENYDNKINIEDLAAICNVTVSYYIRIFKKVYGQTPYQAIMEKRFLSAKYYLQYTDKAISEIAIICGFNDRVHFSQAFKKYYGLSPLDLRKQSPPPPQK